MRKAFDLRDLALPLLALLPAVLIAWLWRSGPLAYLPLFVMPLYAAWRLAQALGLRRGGAFGCAIAWAGLLTLVVVQGGPPVSLALVGGGLVLAFGLSPRLAARDRSQLVGRLGALGVLLVVAGLGGAVLFGTAVPEPTRLTDDSPAARPLVFIPLEVDPTGHRLTLFSLRDDDLQDDRMAVWTVDLDRGRTARSFLGHPFVPCDWSPDGRRFVLPASPRSREEAPQPLGLYLAAADGSGTRERLPAPVDGSSWMYPLWSKQGGLIGAWLLPDVPDLPLGASSDLPRSFVMPVDGGQPHQLSVKGSRLSLFGAWQADGTGAYLITEHGIYVVDGERQRRVVPSGEAPLDPFPFVTPEGVRPGGGALAYLELTFAGGEIKQIDVGLSNLRGKRTRVATDLYPMGLSWSGDGRWLAAAKVDRRDELSIVFFDAEQGRRHQLKTGLMLASRELPVRLYASRDGRYLAIDGQFSSPESWDVAVMDVNTGETKLLDDAQNQLLVGWRHDSKLVIGDLGSVSLINPDGSGLQPVFPASETALPASGLLLGQCARLRQGWSSRGMDELAPLLARMR